jgi:hypothetical protein
MLEEKIKTNKLKIIFGFLLLLGASQEYVNASRELGSFYSPGIIIAILLIFMLSTWLIGTGFNPVKFSFNSSYGIKYFVVSLVAFLIIAFFSLLSRAKPSNFKLVNGFNIPMNRCIDEGVTIISKEAERMKYCLCLAEKITSDSSLKAKYKEELQKGRLVKIFMNLQEDEKYIELGLEKCYSEVEMKWTKNIINSMKANFKKELEGTDFEQTNDTEVYCNCLINEFQKHPLGKIIANEFQESELGISIESDCTEKSKK